MTPDGQTSRTALRRSTRTLERQLPGTASALARSVRAGGTLRLALEDIARAGDPPISDDVIEVLGSVDRGASLDDALDAWQLRRGGRSLGLLVAACRFGLAEGGDLAAALDGAAVSLLDQIEVADEARALSSQARASAMVLVSLPVIGALGFSLLDPSVATTLFTTRPGWICLVLGLLLDAAGAWVLMRIVHATLA